MRICVYGASSSVLDEKYMLGGYDLGRAMAEAGHGLVFGGGDSGLMGAVARGVKEHGGEVIGVAPSFFNVDGVLYQACDEMIYTETMRERKQKMEDLSDAFVMSPGGIGTFEEFFEILTARQLGLHRKAIAILNTAGYFDELIAFLRKAAEQRFMTNAALNIFGVFSDSAELVSYLETYEPTFEGVANYKEIKEEAK